MKKFHFDFVLDIEESNVIFEGIRKLIEDQVILELDIISGYNLEDPDSGAPLSEESKDAYIKALREYREYLEGVLKKIKCQAV